MSDQGREFCKQEIDRLEACTDFKHRVTRAYHPQSNGLDERFNQTFKTSLVDENQINWDELIEDVLFAYKTSRQASTKYTPFFLMRGREARLPSDIHLSVSQENDAQNSDAQDIDKKVKQLIDMSEKAHISALSNIRNAQEKKKTV